MKEYLWSLIAKIVSTRMISDWLINKALKHPWYSIDGIMDRYWLFNPYQEEGGNGGTEKKRSWLRNLLPSVRVHFIFGADQDPHLHDHPWDCRTIILRGWYIERVFNPEYDSMLPEASWNQETKRRFKMEGETKGFKPHQWHQICLVKTSGCWTLFITWKYKEPWGFMVDGDKMLSRDYFEYRKQWRDHEN